MMGGFSDEKESENRFAQSARRISPEGNPGKARGKHSVNFRQYGK
jgi:hypothetical protein